MSFNSELYYLQIEDYLERQSKAGKEITRKDLETVIKKLLKVKNVKCVVRKLRDRGYIEIEEKQIIKFVKA